MLERDGSGTDLDRLERQNLLLIPLDRERTWYRYHHLLGDFLRGELERVRPSRGERVAPPGGGLARRQRTR